jgi:hypothetical protein
MSIKGIVLVVSMALAMVMLAAPAAASATEFTDNGKPVEKGAEFELSGEINVSSLGSGVACVAHSKFGFTSATTIDVTEYKITTNTCVGYGKYKGCAVIGDKPTGLPWVGHVTVLGLLLTDPLVDYTFSNCWTEKAQVEISSLEMEADSTKSIHDFTLSGEAEIETDMGKGEGEVSGTLEIVGEASGTYEIG